MNHDRPEPTWRFACLVLLAFAIVLLVLLGVLVAIEQSWINH